MAVRRCAANGLKVGQHERKQRYLSRSPVGVLLPIGVRGLSGGLSGCGSSFNVSAGDTHARRRVGLIQVAKRRTARVPFHGNRHALMVSCE